MQMLVRVALWKLFYWESQPALDLRGLTDRTEYLMVDNSTKRLVLGTAQLGMSYGIANSMGQPDQDVANAIVREAWDSGICKFDTAQAYGDSERVLGAALNVLGVVSVAKVISKLDPRLDVDYAWVIRGSSRSLP